MTFSEAVDYFLRYLWPLLLAWNVYLYRRTQANKDDLFGFRLHVAENYTSKEDLKEMLSALEERIDKRLNQFIVTINQR